MKRKLDVMITILCLCLIAVLCLGPKPSKSGLWIFILIFVGLTHLVLAVKKTSKEKNILLTTGEALIPKEACTELVLLSEEGSHLASWNIYGKNGIVIGRDVGDNQVTVDLNESPYAGMIDIEHAVLNFAGNHWYIEDVSSKNGVSIQKQDGKRYKISYGKPCRVERFDILFIGLARLKIL